MPLAWRGPVGTRSWERGAGAAIAGDGAEGAVTGRAGGGGAGAGGSVAPAGGSGGRAPGWLLSPSGGSATSIVHSLVWKSYLQGRQAAVGGVQGGCSRRARTGQQRTATCPPARARRTRTLTPGSRRPSAALASEGEGRRAAPPCARRSCAGRGATARQSERRRCSCSSAAATEHTVTGERVRGGRRSGVGVARQQGRRGPRTEVLCPPSSPPYIHRPCSKSTALLQ